MKLIHTRKWKIQLPLSLSLPGSCLSLWSNRKEEHDGQKDKDRTTWKTVIGRWMSIVFFSSILQVPLFHYGRFKERADIKNGHPAQLSLKFDPVLVSIILSQCRMVLETLQLCLVRLSNDTMWIVVFGSKLEVDHPSRWCTWLGLWSWLTI